MKLLLILISLISITALGQTLGDLPSEACADGCTEKMSSILNNFLTIGTTPNLEPAVYSGECYHLSDDYDPNHIHYAVIMISKNDLNQQRPYFATEFVFFAETNLYAEWSLPQAQEQMSTDWKNYGRDIHFVKDSAQITVPYEDGRPAYTYWFRQNPKTQSLYYITFAGGTYMKSFCELSRNP